MLYLTQLLGKTVNHPDGERFGKIAEVLVAPAEPLPRVAAFQVRTNDGALFVPASDLPVEPAARELTLARPVPEITAYRIHPDDVSLGRDMLDKQIVNVHDYRVVRVNDILLMTATDESGAGIGLSLYAVDAGVRGILRRLGMENAAAKLGSMFGRGGKADTPDNVILWENVAALPRHNTGEPLKLKIASEKLSKLHPSEIGEILNQMDPSDRNEVLESFDVETAADALAEADEQVQVAALQQMDEERAADILQEMPADEAADVLGDMDAAHREDLLGRMDAEERGEVEDLLPYNDRTAGGLMTKEFVEIDQSRTAQQTIDTLRRLEPEAETIYYVYVTDTEGRLTGVLSLRDLIVAPPERLIAEFMNTAVRSVAVDAGIDEVAQTFDRYKLLALPVIDSDGRLEGIITVDDTVEQLLSPDWRRRH